MINMITTVIRNHFKNSERRFKGIYPVIVKWNMIAFQDRYNFQTGFNQEPQNSIYSLGQNHFNIDLNIESVLHVRGRSEEMII